MVPLHVQAEIGTAFVATQTHDRAVTDAIRLAIRMSFFGSRQDEGKAEDGNDLELGRLTVPAPLNVEGAQRSAQTVELVNVPELSSVVAVTKARVSADFMKRCQDRLEECKNQIEAICDDETQDGEGCPISKDRTRLIFFPQEFTANKNSKFTPDGKSLSLLGKGYEAKVMLGKQKNHHVLKEQMV